MMIILVVIGGLDRSGRRGGIFLRMSIGRFLLLRTYGGVAPMDTIHCGLVYVSFLYFYVYLRKQKVFLEYKGRVCEWSNVFRTDESDASLVFDDINLPYLDSKRLHAQGSGKGPECAENHTHTEPIGIPMVAVVKKSGATGVQCLYIYMLRGLNPTYKILVFDVCSY